MDALTVHGFLVWMGVWVCFCAVADYVLVIEANAWAMAYGVAAKAAADYVASQAGG